MAKVGAQRAAILTGKSKSTIQRAMNAGKLSYELDSNQRRVIDVSELERVFGIKKESMAEQPKQTPSSKSSSADIEMAVEKERMTMQLKMLEQQLLAAGERIDDLADQRDKWEKQASQMLITSQYTQKQAEELRAQIKEREERARQRRMQNAKLQNTQKSVSRPSEKTAKQIEGRMKRLKAGNENVTETSSVFRFWKKARG